MNRLNAWISAHLLELWAVGTAWSVFCLFSDAKLLHQSAGPQFVYQADAFVHGRLSLVSSPPNLNDWVLWPTDGSPANRHWYVSFPPFPAILMMPFVALNGLAFNDVFFTICLSAINAGLFVYALKHLRAAGEHQRTDGQIAWLTAFYVFGSVYFCTSIRGEVWFTAHVTGVTLTLIYVLASLRARFPVVAGLAFGCAAITRGSMMFAFPFFLVECLTPDGRLPKPGQIVSRLRGAWPKLVRFGVPAAIVLGLAFWMNYARFGKWTEFGHALLYANRVNDDVRKHGLMNPVFLARNMKAAFLLLPDVTWDPFHVGFNQGHGLSIFVTTPLLLLLLLLFTKSRPRLLLAILTTVVATALPGLLYMNDGWYQFGYRFSNDYLPYLFILLAVGSYEMKLGFYVLGLLGLVVGVWGAVAF